MEHYVLSTEHRKKRRRRRAERPAIFAWLTLSGNLKGDIGLISEDLYRDLFGELASSEKTSPGSAIVRYIAISPWSPFSAESVSDGCWTIVPVTNQPKDVEDGSKLPASTLRFSSSSLALGSFAEASQASPTVGGKIKGKSGFEIQVLEVEPLNLDTVFVEVDGIAFDKHDEIQKRFAGGFSSSMTNGFIGNGKGKGKGKAFSQGANGIPISSITETQEQRLTTAIRRALASSIVVRRGDMLPLPLPTHPITHVSLPPAKITFCEPVGQGLMTADTKVVVSRVFHKDAATRAPPAPSSRNILNGITVEEDDDTSNEQFFSAVEDKTAVDAITFKDGSPSSASSDSDEDSGSLSDDSLRNVISMAMPSLPIDSSSFKSLTNTTTPRAPGATMTGLDTPSSMFSAFTVTTTRQKAGEGIYFQTQSLLSKVPDELLHPKPPSDEDEEARVFVDIKMLLKIGCFSGDWVKVKGTTRPMGGNEGPWEVDALGTYEGFSDDCRVIKVYGLPDLSSIKKTRHTSGNAVGRRSSVSSISKYERRTPTAWFSPILLANLNHLRYVKISLLKTPQDSTSISSKSNKCNPANFAAPPVAREVTLSKISSPISTEWALQNGLLAALTQHFEYKRRVLRKGDLVPLRIDVDMSRMLAQPPTTPEVDRESQDLMSLTVHGQPQNFKAQEVAWFRIDQITSSLIDQDSHFSSADTWGGAFSIEPLTTRMVQAGNEQSKVPPALSNTWQYYMGVIPPPNLPPVSKAFAKPFMAPPVLHMAPLRRRLRELIAAATSARAVHIRMEPTVILLHSTQRNIGKATLASRASADLGVHVFSLDAYDLLSEGGVGGADVKTEALFKARAERAMSCGSNCSAILIRHVEALTADRVISALKEIIKDVRILLATTTELENIPEGVRSLFTHELELSAPDESEREGLLQEIINRRSLKLAHDVELAAIATKTAALVAGDLVDVVERAMIAREDRLEALIASSSSKTTSTRIRIRDILVSGGEGATCVTKSDFDLAVDAARKIFADSIGAPKIPNVSWEDVGGLENVKDAVMETIQLPLERPELFVKGMKKRSGILFYGPPGTGKTLLAKAIATEFSLNFFSVKGPELLNMYIGESEANVRRVFQRARDARPCVVFFDELDSVAPKRGNQGDSGGVMDRIVSQLLAELDGMSDGKEGGGGVFVIGATNRPDLLDQALLRPGRFDRMLYLGVSDTHEKQLTILEALTRKFTMSSDMSLRRVAETLPFTYTGADLYALCSDAMLKAIMRQASAVDAKIRSLPGGPVTPAYFFDHLATKDDIAVMVTEEDFTAARRELVASVRFVILL